MKWILIVAAVAAVVVLGRIVLATLGVIECSIYDHIPREDEDEFDF